MTKSLVAAFVEKAQQNGIEVNVWTVDNIDYIRRMNTYGINSIITNDVKTCIAGVR